MISRRAFLGTGIAALAVAAAAGVAEATHRLDDLARAVGVKPRPRPVASDDVLIASVAQDQNRLLGAVEATAARHPTLGDQVSAFAAIGLAHVKAVGGSTTVPGPAAVDTDPGRATRALEDAYARASTLRAKDSLSAGSPDLARVLASMSAGLAQCARALGELR